MNEISSNKDRLELERLLRCVTLLRNNNALGFDGRRLSSFAVLY